MKAQKLLTSAMILSMCLIATAKAGPSNLIKNTGSVEFARAFSKGSNALMRVSKYSADYPIIRSLAKDVSVMSDEYSALFWEIEFRHGGRLFKDANYLKMSGLPRFYRQESHPILEGLSSKEYKELEQSLSGDRKQVTSLWSQYADLVEQKLSAGKNTPYRFEVQGFLHKDDSQRHIISLVKNVKTNFGFFKDSYKNFTVLKKDFTVTDGEVLLADFAQVGNNRFVLNVITDPGPSEMLRVSSYEVTLVKEGDKITNMEISSEPIRDSVRLINRKLLGRDSVKSASGRANKANDILEDL